MVDTATEEKVPLEAKNKPFMVCGFLGVFWNLSYGSEDHLGSTRMVLDEDGTVKEALMYQPYGTVSDVQGISVAGTDPLRQKFTTKELDEEGDVNGAPGIDAYYFGARMYDPDLGMWWSTDPKEQFWNRYGYSTNPNMSVDPDGNWSWLPIIMGVATGGINGALSDREHPGIGFLKGAGIGAFGGVLSNYGGGNLFQNMLWGGVEGAITGAMWAEAFNGDVGRGIWQGALLGMAGAAIQSGIEMGINYRDNPSEYGFHTNEAVAQKLFNEAQGMVEQFPLRAKNLANRAVNFIQERYNLTGVQMDFDYSFHEFGITNKNTGNVRIGTKAFRSLSSLKATVVHEWNHSVVDRIWSPKTGKYEWVFKKGYGNDGPIGYTSEIVNSGRMHINIGTVSDPSCNPVWKNMGLKKWIYTIPKRF